VRGGASSPLPWLGGLLALYLIAPVIAFVVRLGGGVSGSPGLAAALWVSLLTATISAAIITLLGVPLAYVLAHGRGPLVGVLTALVALPLALPPLMSGLLLLYVVGPYTAAGRLFGGQLTDTRAGIVLAQTFVAAPFLIIAARAAFIAVDPGLEDVAASLGHGRFARFRRVAIPAALPGIGAGILLAWLRAFGEFGATVILAYHPYSLPVFTFVQFDATGLPATMLPIAAALLAALVVLLLVQLPSPPRRRRIGPLAAPEPVPSAPPVQLDFALARRLGGFRLDIAHTAASPRLAVLGASGAGKTLTLRLLAGLTPADAGQLSAGGRQLGSLAPERRDIGYVPQQPALLPRRTVWGQVTFGARAKGTHAAWWIERLGLHGLEDRYPDELSGGQQKRVALARALAGQPRVLLLDEPFTGLDAPVRQRLIRELRQIQRDAALSTVIVTHDPEEAAMLADEIIVIDDGRILQAGTRELVFAAPGSPLVAGLLGIANAHDASVRAAGRLECDGVEVLAETGEIAAGSRVAWSVRPERILLDPDGHYRASVADHVDLGTVRELTIVLGDAIELALRTNDAQTPAIGDHVRVEIAPRDVAVWPLPPPAAGARATGNV
jgi:ABC-type Fe3+/spermidine/putrescine transport system ATPase subunit/ABC-type sulfate transport system permease component